MSDETPSPDLSDLICLTMVPGVGPHTSRALLERFGSAGKVPSRCRAVQFHSCIWLEKPGSRPVQGALSWVARARGLRGTPGPGSGL